MLIFRELYEVREYISNIKKSSDSIGFVPTMGALHEGHKSLFEYSLHENDITIGSIFVNPIQFNNSEDLRKYPRTEENDIKMLEEVGCHAVYMPYVDDFYRESPVLKFNFGILEQVMEGSFRPDHFNGVAIVVARFFNIIQPDKAYFGIKDLQQVAVVKQMVTDLSFPVKIRECPIVREPDGLAMSSRNVRIDSQYRPGASLLSKSLDQGREMLNKKDVSDVKKEIATLIESSGIFKLEYFEIVDADTLEEVKETSNHKRIALCVAAWLGDVRLIDNMLLIY